MWQIPQRKFVDAPDFLRRVYIALTVKKLIYRQSHRFLFCFDTGDADTKICGAAQIECYTEEFLKDSLKFRQKCDCLPSCNFITYEAKMDRIELDLKSISKAHKHYLAKSE